MKKLINKKKYSNKKFYILFLILLFTLPDLGISGGGGGGNNNKKIEPDTFPKLPAQCLNRAGKILDVTGRINSTIINNQTYDLSQFHKDLTSNIVLQDDSARAIVEYCKNQDAEVDPEYMLKANPQLFGINDRERQQNFSELNAIKSGSQGNLLIPVSILNARGVPEYFFQQDLDAYSILELNELGFITDANLQFISAIRISGASIAVAAMTEKAQAVMNSGIRVDVQNLQKQLDSIQRLGSLYLDNIDSAKRSLPALKKYDYLQLQKDVNTLSEYFKNSRVGDGRNSDTNVSLDSMIVLYQKTLSTLSTIQLTKNAVRTPFDEMNRIAKAMPGTEPQNLDEMLNAPKKYTVPLRFVSDAVEDTNTIKLFYSCDDWLLQLQPLQKRIDELQSVNQNFIPSLNKKINNLSNSLTTLPAQKKSFERALSISAKKGTGKDFDGSVKESFDVLQFSISKIRKSYDGIVASIEEGKAIKNAEFQGSLAEEKVRLDQLTPKIQAEEEYKNAMPSMIEDAYKKAAEQKNATIALTTKEINENIQKLNALLVPILAEINAQKDASPLWNQSSGSIAYSMKVLTGDRAKLSAVLATTTETDKELRNSLSILDSSVIAALSQANTIKDRIIVSQMMPNYTAAQNLIKIMKGVPASPESFPAALTKYKTDKNSSALISKYNEILATEQKTKALLEENSKVLGSMSQNNPDVKFLTTSIQPLIQPGAATSLDKIFNAYVATQMPAELKVQPLP
ncbi:hypothetical protein [Holospora curviuscula]|uniref:89-kDa periplasmic protein n=1 Tax=Holospora curviuscula TaxID=1082868 RepID=A0A2S5RHV0_9PROT|nr:hypothetical protein [Holospora curviuscula]PPE06899.1 89-kDa periplasmic protein [Holospora curviuscula]